ncbi:diacylglycerol kinase [Mycolicibacterium sp. OfavD-34-C]|uniref:NAD(P)H-dependent amine dehydrogenase family protein n=1 Tax=Mycolicibacterium sp. OfavD-34-C TaxID=2917746 RepID=UPI001EF582A6|nr:diacylglycerol kinase [Mycolicibacterium sp. OfavD-34-C]MCG7581168.1 diacylglycerol kinase [Mycolicibacterium sp. OfavD-34-C]
MALRVIVIGTGGVGAHALRAVLRNPRYDLTGVWVSSDQKAGKDAGELAGLGRATGIVATDDLGALLETKPDCAVYTAIADTRMLEALDDYRRILDAGVNVVGTGGTFLQFPWGVVPDELFAPLELAANANGVSLYVNGIDPGFANDIVPLALAGTCQSVEQIRCIEICDYSTYDSALIMRDLMGFGRPLDDVPMVLSPGALSMAWGSVIKLGAKWLDVELGEITERSVRVPAPESFDTAWGHIAEGTAAALRFEVAGLVDGRPVVVAEHVTRMRDDLCPDWPRPVSGSYTYRIEITGEPSYVMDFNLSSRNGDHAHAGMVATASRVVNSIPAVVAAPPGIVTTLDLPLPSGKGLFQSS